MADNPFEIPQTLRDLSEQTLKQSHAAYEQLSDFVTQAMDAWMGAMPANPMIAGFKDVQGRAMEIAMENAESSFYVRRQDLQRADPPTYRDASDAVRSRAGASLRHTDAATFQPRGRSSPEARTRRRARLDGAIPSNLMPSNSMVTGFKRVQDCAVAMAQKNAESAVALIEKIAKAQNFQELSTLQTGFAQVQMKVFVTQAQELQKLTEEAIQKQVRG